VKESHPHTPPCHEQQPLLSTSCCEYFATIIICWLSFEDIFDVHSSDEDEKLAANIVAIKMLKEIKINTLDFFITHTSFFDLLTLNT
jgi:hypothetical protein